MLAMGTSPVDQAYERIRYSPQGGTTCPLLCCSLPRCRQALVTGCQIKIQLEDFIVDLSTIKSFIELNRNGEH